MTTHETEMATLATKGIRGPGRKALTIALLVVAGAGIAAALLVQNITAGTESATRTATASFSVGGIEQSRALNGPATEVHNPASFSVGAIEQSRALNGPALDQQAARWLQGLSTGLIVPRDVTTRLHQQNPRLAKKVMAAWSASRSPGHGVLDARALNEPGGLTESGGAAPCTMPTIDSC